MKRLVIVVLIGVIGGNIYHNSAEYSKQHPIVYIAEAKAPEIVLIETKIDWTKERIEQEIREVFKEDPDTAVAVAKAESGLNPNALNPEKHKGCKGSYGIFQIACVHEVDAEKLYDIKENIKKAHEIYLEQGWEPWGAYTDGNYKKYLN